jgi:hypothetical protein
MRLTSSDLGQPAAFLVRVGLVIAWLQLDAPGFLPVLAHDWHRAHRFNYLCGGTPRPRRMLRQFLTNVSMTFLGGFRPGAPWPRRMLCHSLTAVSTGFVGGFRPGAPWPRRMLCHSLTAVSTGFVGGFRPGAPWPRRMLCHSLTAVSTGFVGSFRFGAGVLARLARLTIANLRGTRYGLSKLRHPCRLVWQATKRSSTTGIMGSGGGVPRALCQDLTYRDLVTDYIEARNRRTMTRKGDYA